MRHLGVLLFVLAASLAGSRPAAASCILSTVPEQVARAQVVASGTIAQDFEQAGPLVGRTVSFRASRVFKGSLPAIAEVRIGPEMSGVGFGATSVDYRGRAGDHVLYLRVVNGRYETDACSGSHAGGPTAEEAQLLGGGTQPPAATLADEIAALGVLPIVLVAMLSALTFGVLLLARRRYTSPRAGRIPL